MKLAMAALQLVLIQLFISISFVDCNPQHKQFAIPRDMEDPSGYYSLFNGKGTTTEGSSNVRSLIRYGMYIRSGSNHSLVKFLLENQRQFLCPDKKLPCPMDNYRRVWTADNFIGSLPMDGLFCTDREWFSPEENQLVKYSLRFRLIRGVCFTRRQHLSFCDKPMIIFPTGSKCVTFFKDERCSGGEMVNIYSGGFDILENAILGAKSFAFC